MTCFCADLAVDSFSKIYSIDQEKPAIVAPALNSVVSPLIVFHFIGVVNRIQSLRKGLSLIHISSDSWYRGTDARQLKTDGRTFNPKDGGRRFGRLNCIPSLNCSPI